jgi:hypothetical protein
MYSSRPLYPVGDQRAHADLAVARNELHPGPALMPRSSASSGETSTNVSGVFRGSLDCDRSGCPRGNARASRPLFRCRSNSALGVGADPGERK